MQLAFLEGFNRLCTRYDKTFHPSNSFTMQLRGSYNVSPSCRGRTYFTLNRLLSSFSMNKMDGGVLGEGSCGMNPKD